LNFEMDLESLPGSRNFEFEVLDLKTNLIIKDEPLRSSLRVRAKDSKKITRPKKKGFSLGRPCFYHRHNGFYPLLVVLKNRFLLLFKKKKKKKKIFFFFLNIKNFEKKKLKE